MSTAWIKSLTMSGDHLRPRKGRVADAELDVPFDGVTGVVRHPQRVELVGLGTDRFRALTQYGLIVQVYFLHVLDIPAQ